MSQAEKEPTLPTVTGFAARQLLAVLHERKVAVAPLLRLAGLTNHGLTDRQHRISAASQSRLLEVASEALGDDALGFHLATLANPREAGLLFYITSAAKTVGEALVLFERYCRIVNEAVCVKRVRVPNGIVLQVGFVGLSRYHAQQTAEFGIAVILKARKLVAVTSAPPKWVSCWGAPPISGNSRASTAVRSSSGRHPISSNSRLRRWLCRSSLKIRTCSRRSSQFVMPPREHAALKKERFVPWSRTNCKKPCRTATFASRV